MVYCCESEHKEIGRIQPDCGNRVAVLTISKSTQRRFLLGKQGLYPGHRWRGKAGVVAALQAGADVQVDPLNVVARSPDIALFGRVLDYRPDLLQALLYEDRACFESGGAVNVHPIEELPYWRVAMARKVQEPRHAQFAQEQAAAIEMVRQAIHNEGPRSAADFQDSSIRRGVKAGSRTFRSSKLANQALYYLWLAGELMTHHRQGPGRVYDLRERLVPTRFNGMATVEEAEGFFALHVLQRGGFLPAQQWRAWFAGTAGRPVEMREAADRLEALERAGTITQVLVADAPKAPCYLLAADLPLLEALHAGHVPSAWQPLGPTTEDEMVFLAPLEILTARGRALSLFDFEYLWEVYKPPEQRRWGYYTLPVLYQDRLVARTDLKLERAANTLVVKGFWLESHAIITEQFVTALARAVARFMDFIGATALDDASMNPAELRDGVRVHLN
jgi:hypothetical protein